MTDTPTFVLGRFPGQRPPNVVSADGCYLHLQDGRKVLDASGGYSACVWLGFNHPEVIEGMKKQLDKFCYVPSFVWGNPQTEELGEILLSNAPSGLDRVYYSGTSGSDSLEAAMKLSYQVNHSRGKPEKSWFICRDESYHGATLHALSVTNVDIWDFYEPLLPKNIAVIPQHNPYAYRLSDETMEEYAARGAKQLEDKILEIGPEKVSAFIAETMLGQLVGNVPPAESYWRRIREVCDRYDVHLILDEVYCGLGRSGKIHCCSWDDCQPDFLCLGKMLGAGYSPISAVLTKSEFESLIQKKHGRVMYAHTYQAHAVGVAAALSVQKIVHRKESMEHVNSISSLMFSALKERLGTHPFFKNLRGRGLLITLEYECPDKHKLGSTIERRMLEEHNIVINSRWHRSSFTPPMIITAAEANRIVDCYVDLFLDVARQQM